MTQRQSRRQRDTRQASQQEGLQPSALQVISREEALTVDGCAVWPHIVPQWAKDDGTQRGVKLRALTLKQRMEAHQAALRDDKTIDQFRLMIEELRRGIIDPPNIPAEVIESWNADVVLAMYETLQMIGGWNPIIVERELERLASGTS
jgi:hypothetical protein